LALGIIWVLLSSFGSILYSCDVQNHSEYRKLKTKISVKLSPVARLHETFGPHDQYHRYKTSQQYLAEPHGGMVPRIR
jgi:hypothetical protein